MTRNSIRTYALCSSALVALAYGSSAYAATADAAAEEVVVTGSRVITNGFAAPTPVTVVTAQQMQMTAPNSLSDAINELPQFKGSFVSVQSGPVHSSNADGSYPNLRGLGAKRSLTLLDGQRIVQTVANGSVAGATDLSVLPQSLIQKVDITTGGGSAQYGSDALSGVINFTLNTKFVGLKGEVRGGVTSHGDDTSGDINLAFGTSLMGGRAHLIGSIEYYHTAGVPSYMGRDWASHGTGFIATGCPTIQTSLACPTRAVYNNIQPSNMSIGGLIVTGATALRNQSFTSTTTLTPFPLGALVTATTMVGGGLDGNLGSGFVMQPPATRGSGFLRLGYDLTPDWSVNASLMYSTAQSNFSGTFTDSASMTQNLTLFSDNVFLPASIVALMSGPGATSAALYNPATGLFNGATRNTIAIGRIDADWGKEQEFNTNSMLRFAGGIDGKFDVLGKPWNVTGYYTHGQAWHKGGATNTPDLVNIFNAVDAVASPGTAGLPPAGTPICRSTITSPNNACVPLNILGPNAASPQAINYIMDGAARGTTFTGIEKLVQDAMELNVRGEPFSTWAGPVAIGAGLAYRKETVVATSDAISESYNPAIPGTAVFKAGVTPPLTINGFPSSLQGARGGWVQLNGGGFTGALDVKEAYGEALIPLAKDMFLAKQLNLNAAIRYADYQYGGGQTNWKVGMVYQPIDDLRFRVTEFHDIRAPNLADLFAGLTQTNGAVTDPFRRGTTGVSESNSSAITFSGGNAAVQPEVGDTLTMGLVYRPTWNKWVDGLSVSLDYYNIIITNAIGTVSALNQCFAGNTFYCQFVVRQTDPATFGAGNTIGAIVQIFSKPVNVGTTKNNGIDIEVSYRLPLAKIWPDRKDVFTVRAIFNDMTKNQTFTLGGTSQSNTVGINSGGIIPGSGGSTDWQGNINFNYNNGPLTVNVQERFINKGRLSATIDEAGNPLSATSFTNPNTAQSGQVPNTVPAYFYTDLNLTYKFGHNERYEAFLTISNLFDKDPPAVLGSFFFYGVQPSNATLYDVIGRNFTGGLRFKF